MSIVPNIQKVLTVHKLTIILILTAFILVGGGIFAFQKLTSSKTDSQPMEEFDLAFDPEGPYALLIPRRDGNAMNVNIKRTASYDAISYELAYNSEGVDRGVVGDVDTSKKKGEYQQEVLFGTCSKNVCKYDKEVENGTLILHIKKGKQAFRAITQWHLQIPEQALGKLNSLDGHFSYQANDGIDLKTTKFTIINDLSGVPKLPSGKKVVGKVYAVSVPLAKSLAAGKVSIELADTPFSGAQIAYFNEGANEWKLLESKVEGNKLTAIPEGPGIFAVLAPNN